jgi:hypothetical protein
MSPCGTAALGVAVLQEGDQPPNLNSDGRQPLELE